MKRDSLLAHEKLNPYLIYGGGIFLSIIIFVCIYGIKILDPQYVDWRFLEADTMHDYIGWCGFRYSDWSFPLGLFDTLSYPDDTSIIFPDSIPIFAIFFKIVSPFLPETFQYFGIFALLCFVLQAFFTIKVIRKYTDNIILNYLSVIFMCLMPVLVFKFFTHTALGAHWIILFSIYILLSVNDFSYKRLLIDTSLLAFFASSIHMYFMLFAGINVCGIALYYYLSVRKKNASIFRSLIESFFVVMLFLLVCIGVVALLGGFSMDMDLETIFEYKDIPTLNLNGFINSYIMPTKLSTILPINLSVTNMYQMDAMSYMGLGAIILVIVACAIVLFNIKNNGINWRLLIVVALLLLVSLLFAISPVITLNDKVIAVIPFPSKIYKIWEIFRYSNRVFWNCIYILCLLSLCVIVKYVDFRIGIGTIVIVLVLNVYDYSGLYISKRETYTQEYSFYDHNEEINILGSIKEGREHVVLADGYEDPFDSMWIWNWIVQNKMTCNTFYFARKDSERFNTRTKNSIENESDDTIFVFERRKDNYKKYVDSFNYYETNDYVIGVKK